MSLENVVSFWQRVQTDPGLQARVKPGANVPKLQAGMQPSELDGLARIATEVGFACTAGELVAAENVIRFWERVPKDAMLQEALKPFSALPEDKAMAETVKVANQNGFQFTAREMSVIAPAIFAAGKVGTELNDKELDAVSGGILDSSLNLSLRSGWSPSLRINIGSVSQYM